MRYGLSPTCAVATALDVVFSDKPSERLVLLLPPVCPKPLTQIQQLSCVLTPALHCFSVADRMADSATCNRCASFHVAAVAWPAKRAPLPPAASPGFVVRRLGNKFRLFLFL